MKITRWAMYLLFASFSILITPQANAQLPNCHKCLNSFQCDFGTSGSCSCNVTCVGGSCSCTVCGVCTLNKCIQRAPVKPSATSWWATESTQALSAAVMKVSPTLGKFLVNFTLTMNRQPKTDDDAATMSGKTDVATREGFVDWRTKVETLRSEAGTKWNYLLGERVMRMKPGVDHPSEADIETVPDVHPEADRLEITVLNGQYSWAVYKGTDLLGEGVVTPAASSSNAPAQPEVVSSGSSN